MNLVEFMTRRAAQAEPAPRETCDRCRKARRTCYCHMLRPFVAPSTFVILQHPDESRNAIATARMAHLSMTNSQLFVGDGFRDHAQVNQLIEDASQHHVVLYPSPGAVPIERLLDDATTSGDPRPLTFWVLDAKWSQVSRMLNASPNVQALPRVTFNPDRISLFQPIRKQPRAAFLSTIESIYVVIDRILQHRQAPNTEHRTLLDVFQYLVHQQLGFVNPHDSRHRVAKQLRASRRVRRELGA